MLDRLQELSFELVAPMSFFLRKETGAFDEFRYLDNSFHLHSPSFVNKKAPHCCTGVLPRYQSLLTMQTAVHSSLIPITLEGRLYFLKFSIGSTSILMAIFTRQASLLSKISNPIACNIVYEKRLVLSTIRMSFFF